MTGRGEEGDSKYATYGREAEGVGDAAGPLAEQYQDMVILMREADRTVRLSILQYGGVSSLDPS